MNKTKSLLVVAGLIVGGALAFVGCESGHDQSTNSQGAAAAKPYPLKTCIVTDEKLGGHGEPYAFVHQGQEIKLCCESCREDFDKEPAKYLSKLNAAK